MPVSQPATILPLATGAFNQPTIKQIGATMLWFTQLEDFKLWIKGMPPEFNVFAYLKMVEERNHATRLEF